MLKFRISKYILSNRSKSLGNFLLSSVDEAVLKIHLSSARKANNIRPDHNIYHISKNRTGASTVPCDTLHTFCDEIQIWVQCFLSLKNFFIHLHLMYQYIAACEEEPHQTPLKNPYRQDRLLRKPCYGEWMFR